MRKKKVDPWQELIQMVQSMDDNYQSKMEFVSSFLRKVEIGGADDNVIFMNAISLQAFKYFIYAIITEYEKTK